VGLSNRSTAGRALTLSEREEGAPGGKIDIYLNDSVYWREHVSTSMPVASWGVHIQAANPNPYLAFALIGIEYLGRALDSTHDCDYSYPRTAVQPFDLAIDRLFLHVIGHDRFGSAAQWPIAFMRQSRVSDCPARAIAASVGRSRERTIPTWTRPATSHW